MNLSLIALLCFSPANQQKPGTLLDFVDNRQNETLNPDLYVAGQLNVSLPGTGNLYVELWDYDVSS